METLLFDKISTNTLTLIANACHSANITHRPTIILGLSGGPDSVFLFHVLATLQTAGHVNVIAAHLDHEWRTTSRADAQFCTNLCESAGVALVSAKASELALPIKFNGSKEDVGRRLRRHFFEQTRQHHTADFIALAHHRNDQQETFFLRLLRGTTIKGLTCMRTIDGRYLRPLLTVDKTQILAYLDGRRLPFCTDQTNTSPTYLRNRIRMHVIPELRRADSRFDKKLESSIAHIQEEDAYLQCIAQESFNKIFKEETNKPHLPATHRNYVGTLPEFKKLHPVMQRRVLLVWFIAERVPFTPSTTYLEEARSFIIQAAGGNHQIGNWRLCKKGIQLWIEKMVLQDDGFPTLHHKR